MRAFDQGPYTISRRNRNAPSGLAIPANVRLFVNAITQIYLTNVGGGAAGATQVSRSHYDSVAWWRRKKIVIPNIQELANKSGGSQKFTLLTTDKLLNANGGESSSGMSASTLYYVYLNPDGILKASATAYVNSWDGVRILGDSAGARDWLFWGWVRTDGSTNFLDSITNRWVNNWYNSNLLSLYAAPAYNNDALNTRWTTTSTSWTQANGGTGNSISFISNGFDATFYGATAFGTNDTAPNISYIGIGVDSTTSAEQQTGYFTGTNAWGHGSSIQRPAILSEAVHTLYLLCFTLSSTARFYADDERRGSAADPAATYIYATVVA